MRRDTSSGFFWRPSDTSSSVLFSEFPADQVQHSNEEGFLDFRNASSNKKISRVRGVGGEVRGAREAQLGPLVRSHPMKHRFRAKYKHVTLVSDFSNMSNIKC